MVEPTVADPRTLPAGRLQRIRDDRVQHVLTVVTKLCAEAKRKDGDKIIESVAEDLEQLLVIGEENGRRLDVKGKS